MHIIIATWQHQIINTKAAGVELVIYPHWSGAKADNISIIESAWEALPNLNEIQSDNLLVSLHLSHEIRAGNGERLNEIAAKIKPWLRLPSINIIMSLMSSKYEQ